MPQSCLPASITENGEDHGQKMPVENTISPELMSFLEKLECKPDAELNLSYEDQQSLDKHLQELDCVCNVLRQAKNKIREQDRKKTADKIRGDFDNPLDKVFNDLKPFFVLDEDSFKNLACVSKGMRQALKDVRVCTDVQQTTLRKENSVRLSLPLVHEKICPRLIHFGYEHNVYRYDASRPRVDVALGNRLLNQTEKLESFCFTTSTRIAHNLKFQDFEGFKCLRKFIVETERFKHKPNLNKFEHKPKKVQENYLLLPNDLNLRFPMLTILHLVDVTCPEEYSELYLPKNLEVLFLERVKGLRELQNMPTQSLNTIKLVNVPDLVISELPQTVEDLFVSFEIANQIDSLPDSMQNFKFDGKDAFGTWLQQLTYDGDFQLVYEKLPSHMLQRVKFIHISTEPVHKVPIAHSVFYEKCQNTTKFIVEPQVSLVSFSFCYDLREIEIGNGVEHVALSCLPELRYLVLPASCRSVAIRNCCKLKKLVFKGGFPEKIGLFGMEKLEEIKVEDDARKKIPQDVLDIMLERGNYPLKRDMSEILYEFLHKGCEDSFVKWTQEQQAD